MKTFTKANSISLIIITSIIILFACNKKDIIQTGTGTGNGTVRGIITDLNNLPVSNAIVTGGTATALTDITGKFTLTQVQFSNDTVSVTVTKDGFFEGAKKFAANNNAVNNAKIQLISKPVSGSVSAALGGNVSIQGGGSVNFTGGFITASNGNAYTGNVSVSTFYLNPADQSFSANVPGDVKSINATNQPGVLQSYGVIAIEMNDAAGNKLQLASGKTATLSIPIPSSLQSKAPSSIPLWFFDVTKSIWKQEGSATKQGSNYIGVVSHFTFWNVGDIAGSLISISATFIDSFSKKPFANKLVTITRHISLADSSFTSSRTDSSGKVSGLVPANEVLRMEVFDTCGLPVYSKNIGPFTSNIDLGNINVTRSNCNQPPLAVAGFTYSVLGSSLPVTVNFSNTSTNATSWIWNFGDGGTSTEQNPFHSYLTAGDYVVKLIASGPTNSDTSSQILHLFNQPATVAGFIYSFSGNNLPVTVNFTNISTNATSWLWKFGDGSTSTIQNPSHTYSTAGDYTVKLIASGTINTDSTSQILHVLFQANDTYINLTLNGTNYSWAPSVISGKYVIDSASSGGLRKYTLLEGQDAKYIGFSFENGNTILPGNYNVYIGFIINGKSYSHNDLITTTVTEYGAVGGYIIGSASGQVFEKSDTATKIPFSMQYKVTRMQ